jgi:hypothetical protein
MAADTCCRWVCGTSLNNGIEGPWFPAA